MKNEGFADKWEKLKRETIAAEVDKKEASPVLEFLMRFKASGLEQAMYFADRFWEDRKNK